MRYPTANITCVFILLLFFFGGCTSSGNGAEPDPGNGPEPPAYVLHGLNFSPYIDGQNPNWGTPISEQQLGERLAVISQHTEWIRTFGCGDGLEHIAAIAQEDGLHTAIGAWLSDDTDANEEQITNLINVANDVDIEIAIVGSEVLYRGDLGEDDLIGYINRVRDEVPDDILITTADTYGELIEHPDVVEACDIIFANIFPYWEGIVIEKAVAALNYRYKQLEVMAGGKDIIIAETGWPSCGDTIGDAVPSADNASFYFLNFISWARANDVGYFYFEAFDETWKALYEGPQGACWGVWDKEGEMKDDMQDVFDGQTMEDNWSSGLIPGGDADPPEIEFTHVPPIGSQENLRGQVWHVMPSDYKVAVYIKVSGGWWTKPYWDYPLTFVDWDGSWVCDITTGGNDETATRIAAYLIPVDYDPPKMAGGASLPEELEQNSVANTEVDRPPD